MSGETTNWHRLDNAAKIFPAVAAGGNSTVFRLAATLIEDVDPGRLQAAVDRIMPRFPYYRVKLRTGLFWHYLQDFEGRLTVSKENRMPCSAINRRADGCFLLRVQYFGRRITVEFSHVLADGMAASVFMRSLVCEYFLQMGVEFELPDDIIQPDQPLDPEEHEDAYLRYYDKDVPRPALRDRAYHVSGKSAWRGGVKVITGIIDFADLKTLCSEKGATVTDYLVAVYMFALQEQMRELLAGSGRARVKPVRIIVPVDVRRLLHSKTMRNFMLQLMPGVDTRLGFYSFEEILEQVHHYMRMNLNEKQAKQILSRNVGGETNIFVRLIPSFLKLCIARWVYVLFGAGQSSGVLSNLGPVLFPDAIKDKVERVEFITTPNRQTRLSLGVVGYNGLLYVTFGSLVADRDIPKRFFRFLRRQGLHVKVETN